MTFGLSDSEYQFILMEVVAPIKKMGGRVWCYGSRARGDHRRFSDLDLMVEANRDLSAELSEIREKLSNSNFPYKVDLVLLSEFADSYKAGFEKDKRLFDEG